MGTKVKTSDSMCVHLALKCTCILSVLLAAWSCPAIAHGTNPGMALIRLAGDVLYVTATPKMTVFLDFDTNGDGHISRKELSKQRPEMITYFSKLLVFSSSDAHVQEHLLQDISAPHSHSGRRTHLRVTTRIKLTPTPTRIDVEWKGAKIHPLALRAQRMTPGKLAKQRPLGPVATAILNARYPKAQFFADKKRTGKEITE